MGGLWVHNASQHVNDVSQYPTILAVCVCLTIWMLIIVGLRVYVRGHIIKSFGADDWTILFSAVCSVIYNGLAIGQSRWGLGLPIALRPKVNLNEYSTINFAGRPFYMAGITGFKVALCLAYLRIVHRNNRFYKTLIWTVGVFAVLTHVAGTLVLIFQCKPVQKSWRPSTPGHCLPNDITFYALAGITIFFDCIIFFLPIPLLVQVKINRRRKIALIGVFMLGLFTTVCSVMRMVQIPTIAMTGNSTMLVLWGTVEMNVGIGLTCIPTLTPLFNYFRDRNTTRKDSSYAYSAGSAASHPLSNLRKDDRHRLVASPSVLGEREHAPAAELVELDDEKPGDGESQKSILPHHGSGAHPSVVVHDSPAPLREPVMRDVSGRIIRTTEVSVEVEEPLRIGRAVSTRDYGDFVAR
ncbi:MAG: hypothetical protein M1824_004787 [Vezdaea acicularis]|nr:MAG: hypothetical protein M1824_004787 [Vezdaea acicularis]